MKYKHALCLNPYVKESSAAMGFFPPIGLEYVAASLIDHVGNVTVMDLRQEKDYHDIRSLTSFIHNKKIDLICVSINWNFFFKEVCGLINSLPDSITLVAGGQQATESVEELFQKCPNIDIIVRGEGEETIQEVAKGMDLQAILGISYKNNGSVIHNPNRPLPEVDSLRNPDRGLRRASYHVKSKGVKVFNTKFDTVLSARGCPFNCKFCTMDLNPLGQKRFYSARSPESVVDEIQSLDAEMVFFADDNFFVNTKRVEKICDLLIERGIKKRFITQARIEIYKHPELMKKVAKAGFKMMLIGIESPHDWILKQIDKGFTSEEVRRAFKALNELPFYYHCYFIYGNIGESREEMLYIPEFAQEIGADSISFQKLQVRKFSPLKEIVEKTPGYHLDINNFVYSDKYSMKDLRQIQKGIKKKFYTLKQIYRIIGKLYGIKFITNEDLFWLFMRFPLLFYKIAAREIEKKYKRKKIKVTPDLPFST
ncbi:MAG: B12-binding domain-containing radical SAM protein [Nitrospirae bacterium]|nr:B12-binding domain-containing radical SAM protein [Nitrospirota bacterium]